jgi:tetratricopeptide (TPR) repeat protein
MSDMNNVAPPKQEEKLSAADNLLVGILRYKTIIIAFVLLLAVAGIGAYAWIQKTRADEQKANLELSTIAPYMHAGELRKAIDGDKNIKGLKSIVSDFGGTASGNMARLYLGTIYFSMHQPDSALVMYRSFSHTNKDLQAAALAGQAACETEKKEFAKAAASYEKASTTAENDALKSDYLNKSAENLVSAGSVAKGRALYDQIIKSWPGSSAAGVAQRSLWRLSGSGQ